MTLEVPEYKPDELQIKIANGMVTIEGSQVTTNSSRSFFKKFSIPQGVKPEEIRSSLSPNGRLTISAPILAQDLNQKQTQASLTSTTSTKTETEEQEHQLKSSNISNQEHIQQKNTVRSMENSILQTILNADKALAKDTRFEDVSQQISKPTDGKTFEVCFLYKLGNV